MNHKPQPLAWLPNSHGYKFIGVTARGERVPCVVRRNPDTGLHIIEGAPLSELIGWVEK